MWVVESKVEQVNEIKAILIYNQALSELSFRKGTTRYELYWTNDDTPARMTWPAGTVAAYDLYGQPLPVVGSDLEVNFNPIFIEIVS